MIRLSGVTGVLLLLCCLSFAVIAPVYAVDVFLIDNFETDLARWRQEIFHGENDYRLVSDGAVGQVLHASSQQSASALVQTLDIDPIEYPVLRWRWKIDQTLKTGDARIKAKDDYAARIYVVFPHWFKPLSRSINYIWANKLKQGDAVPSPYFSRSVMLSVESGDQLAGQWMQEERNLVDDYRRLFGVDPPRIGAIAIMTDTDGTGEAALAWYDDLILMKKD